MDNEESINNSHSEPLVCHDLNKVQIFALYINGSLRDFTVTVE